MLGRRWKWVMKWATWGQEGQRWREKGVAEEEGGSHLALSASCTECDGRIPCIGSHPGSKWCSLRRNLRESAHAGQDRPREGGRADGLQCGALENWPLATQGSQEGKTAAAQQKADAWQLTATDVFHGDGVSLLHPGTGGQERGSAVLCPPPPGV